MFLLNVHRISAVGDERFDMVVSNQVSYMTLSEAIHVSVMPHSHRYFFLERYGSPTKGSVNGY